MLLGLPNRAVDYLVVSRIESKPVSLDSAEILRKEFKVSLTAAAIKLVKKATAPTCAVCFGQSKREWFVTNASFPYGVVCGERDAADSAGFELLYGSVGGHDTIQKGIGGPLVQWNGCIHHVGDGAIREIARPDGAQRAFHCRVKIVFG
jgi:hypothetical protein